MTKAAETLTDALKKFALDVSYLTPVRHLLRLLSRISRPFRSQHSRYGGCHGETTAIEEPAKG
jgi:hypothetical protein